MLEELVSLFRLAVKVSTENIPVNYNTCGIEELIKNFRTKALAHEFIFECKEVLKHSCKKNDINFTGKVFNRLILWLEQITYHCY